MGECQDRGKTRWYYTGNQVGDFNFTGDYNFVSGGPPGIGLHAGTLVPVFFPPPISRSLWRFEGATLTQEQLDACYPFIELNWICDIELKDTVFRVAEKNIYVQDENGNARFYEARVQKGPQLTVTLGEWLNPQFEIGDLKLTLNNRDGFFNPYLPQGELYTQWISTRVTIRVGFGEKISNYFVLFHGYISAKQGLTTTEDSITLKCYDQFDKDEIPIPATTFTSINYPDIDDQAVGKPIPLVYGDWTEEVGDFGEVPAFCINAKDINPAEYIFKISENSLHEIKDIYLHRGDRAGDSPDGPILLDDNFVLKEPEFGQFRITNGAPALTESYIVIKKGTAGDGSGTNVLTSDKASFNFITKGVRPGDVIIKTKTSEQAVVESVANNQLVLSGGISFSKDDEYSIITINYSYLKGDKFSVKLIGKNVRRISTNRLEDADLPDAIPVGLTVGLDGTFWFADNAVKKVYQVSFRNEVKRVINFTDIHSSITEISGLSVQTDDTIWVFDKPSSTIYRYLLRDSVLGISFRTIDIVGLGISLGSGVGLTIDTDNRIYIVDNSSGVFYKINPFASPSPVLITSWHRDVFDPAALETLDLSIDVNAQELALVDRDAKKYYRISPDDGSYISDFDLTDVNENADFVVGVSIAQDGTTFFLNRSTNELYNYNEDPNAIYNPGFIARDVIQNLAGKVSTDFDLIWNETAREDLFRYRGRLYLGEKTNIITAMTKFLRQFNAALFVKFTKYAIFQIEFFNFHTNGKVLREGDIKLDSFKPSKEYNQYFNSSHGDYKKLPFSNITTRSDTYVSPTGIRLAEKEINKKIDLPDVYRRADVDQLYPLFVRLAAAEPEFVDMEVGFKRVFTQLMDFFMIDFDSPIDCVTGQKKGGRRFDKVPCFVRQITFSLDTMSLRFKVWSLGTTRFPGYTPKGDVAGGYDDQIVLTNLGTLGYISPTGTILSATANSIILEDVSGFNAENRVANVVGRAWDRGYAVSIIDGATHEILETLTIDTVVGPELFFTGNITTALTPTVRNGAGFIVSGHYLRYCNYEDAVKLQKRHFAFYGTPTLTYPNSTSLETEEQRSGLHNFPDGRVPYIIYPKDFSPA